MTDFSKIQEAYINMYNEDANPKPEDYYGELYPGEKADREREQRIAADRENTFSNLKEKERQRRLEAARRGNMGIDATKEEMDAYTQKSGISDDWKAIEDLNRRYNQIKNDADISYFRKTYDPEKAAKHLTPNNMIKIGTSI